ncbi:MAG: response regulator [Gammaproteobacteria bacterium]|nr:MAG: response regulator [Gammaproteobacteria bacterium]
MKTLIVEDDHTSRLLMRALTQSFGPVHLAVNGREAVDSVARALKMGEPYDFICLDIMMPEMDGQEALKAIRNLEQDHEVPLEQRAKIIMTTALDDMKTVMAAYGGSCDGYLTKPVDQGRLLDEMRSAGLLDTWAEARR